ncbi:flagellar motor protein MotD [Sideroxydans lithotrophicus]|uniref:OmpA/MotB domain protein n=1 Tax=Sideroxydans lithotrophicus (strain ES-1) TaxID=580332 RepID=D5CMW5_SIDLE|nr:flagellar motor protein MotD [Sideroxydans lithotrophicus]ADE10801.1 OmpA/MotB domain protein [Sideroxydans lithotrophicus ES-1]
MARRPKRAEHDNHERWMVSYADFITLLFAFFVVMYGISSVNEGKYKVFSVSVNQAFGANGKAGEGNAIHLSEQEMYFKSLVDRRNARLAEIQRKQNESMQNLAKDLNASMASFVKNGQMNVSQTGRGVELEINASALFKQGEADIEPEALKTLADAAKVLAGNDFAIEVEGHTDNLPISTPKFPSNWELSSARASSVVRLFIDQGITAKRLKAVGSADNQPVDSNDTPEGRARNRRVTITVLNPVAEPEPTVLSAPEQQ